MRILSILASALLLTSCLFDTETTCPEPSVKLPAGSMADVSFMAAMPGPRIVATRSVGSVAENKITDIHILVFEKTGTEKLVYKGKGRSLAVSTDPGVENVNRVTFKATLPVGTAYNFMVLANAESLLSGISVSNSTIPTKADVLELTRSLTAGARWLVDPDEETMAPIPMWGEINKNEPLTASDAITFKLTRMLARVNVLYRPNTSAASDFRLTSIRVYNTGTVGAVVPAAANWDSSKEIITNATEPEGSAGYGIPDYDNPVPLVYDGSDISNYDTCKDLIYLFETPHNGSTYMTPTGNSDWIDNPCLVIGGKFSPDGVNWSAKDTYYRVDFIKKGTDEFGAPVDEWLPVLRNFSYNVTITEVINEGYADAETALKSAPINMKANILPWNERNMDKVVFDGVFYLSVSRDDFVFQRRETLAKDTENETNVVRIKTDYLVGSDPANPGSGWKVDRIVKAGTNEPIDWNLNLVPHTRPGNWSPNDVDEAYFTFDANPGPTNREADVWIKAGRLEFKIHVLQKIMSLEVLDNGNNRFGEEYMTFVIPDAGTDGLETRPFKVRWTPSGQPVTITGRNMANGAFEPGWITGGPVFPNPVPYGSTNTPAQAAIPAQPGVQVGEQGFIVQPAAVTPQMLTNDPFYETHTTYYFKIDNLGETMTDSIGLRQIHYDIKADTHKYRLDGGVHTLTVRSNADWEIISVEEHLFNSELPTPKPLDGTPVMIDFRYAYDNLKDGLEFGPNVNGTALAFHVVDNESQNHKGKWGFVWVTLKMTTPYGAEKIERVLMQFPPPTKLLVGIGYHDATYSTNPGINTHWHNNSAFQMLSSPYNFGSMDESTYKVEGFRIIGHNAQGLPNGNPTDVQADRDWHPNSMKNWLNNDNPDVIVTGDYDSDGYIARYSENEIQLLKQFVDNGGALILMNNGGVTYEEIMGRFLTVLLEPTGGPYTTGTGGTTLDFDVKNWIAIPASGAYYQLNNVDDPVLKGPFGDVRGLLWGSHYHTGGIKTSLITDVAIPLAGGKEQSRPDGRGHEGYTTIFRHKTKNFIFIGCGGFVGSSYPSWQQGPYPGYAPFYCDPNNYFKPAPRTNWKEQGSSSTTPTVSVQNSIVFANAVAWALTVSNHTPPIAGYKNINE